MFTLPFAVVTLATLSIRDERGLLQRVEEPSYPEKQAWLGYKRWREARREATAVNKAFECF